MPASDTIVGSVSGLKGSGLMLRDNGVDDLAITNDGPFTFATHVTAGEAYSIVVYTQPTDPSQDRREQRSGHGHLGELGFP